MEEKIIQIEHISQPNKGGILALTDDGNIYVMPLHEISWDECNAQMWQLIPPLPLSQEFIDGRARKHALGPIDFEVCPDRKSSKLL